MVCTRTPLQTDPMQSCRSMATRWSTIVPASANEFHPLVSFPFELHSELAHSKSCPTSCRLCDHEICCIDVLKSPLDFQRTVETGGVYPSPPPCGSQATRSIPLPSVTPGFLHFEAGGILDSPSIRRSITHFPLSPPPTGPTSTLALPPADDDIHADDAIFALSMESDDLYATSRGGDEHDEQCFGSSSPTKAATQPLLPLSPEWEHVGMSEKPTRIAGRRHLSDLPSPYSAVDSELPFDDQTQSAFILGETEKDSRFPVVFSDFDIVSFPPAGAIMKNSPDNMRSGKYSDPGDVESSDVKHETILDCASSALSRIAHVGARSSSWDPQDHTCCYPSFRPKAILLDHPPEAGIFDPRLKCQSALHLSNVSPAQHNALQSEACIEFSNTHDLSPQEHDNYERRCTESNDIPSSLLPSTQSSIFDDFSTSTSLNSPLVSPSSQGLALLPDHESEIMLIDSPSPSRRSVKELPVLDGVDDVFLSPTQSLLSLPGVEADDELIPSVSFEFSRNSYPFTPSEPKGLLLFDDGSDFPTRRSPSPEDFHADLDPNCEIFPEYERLRELSKKSNSVERAARQMEDLLLEQGAIQARNEARRMRKFEKEKGKEIIALLRLKLGDDMDGNLERGRSTTSIAGMPQLVARMFFRRRGTSRALADRRVPALEPIVHAPSPLSQVMSADDLSW